MGNQSPCYICFFSSWTTNFFERNKGAGMCLGAGSHVSSGVAHAALRLAHRWLSRTTLFLSKQAVPGSFKSLCLLDVSSISIRMGGGGFAPEGGDSEERKEAESSGRQLGPLEGWCRPGLLWGSLRHLCEPVSSPVRWARVKYHLLPWRRGGNRGCPAGRHSAGCMGTS